MKVDAIIIIHENNMKGVIIKLISKNLKIALHLLL